MSTEEGTITKVSGDKAWVKIRRSSMCEHCGSQSVCSSLSGGETMETEALNTSNGQVGDRVLIKIPTKSLVKISFIFYMIPVIFLVAGLLAGLKLGEQYFFDPELGSFLTGITACGVSFIIIKLFANRVKKNKDYTPEIIKII
jgi:sigma-E factor negative regulatory protein RseC